MVMRLTLGVDPGLTGAVAVLADGHYREVLDMPTVGRGKAGRQSVNAAALSQWIRDVVAKYPGADVVAVVEEVASRPRQGVVSMFRFGQSCGVLAGVLAALRIPVVYVTPQRWKRFYSLTGTEKDAARGRAVELYPDAPLARKRDVGRADAILMARWGWKTEAHLEVA